ncbi:MAG: TetR/AcrR family transcriptional regulator [Treponema sp.]|nr:TetR/AcrR family transcriptional regulator [Treponema sp.]
MTKNDIIKAAFKVWGQELYRTTSLSKVARELGVSKPALYRHFTNKDALLQAMFAAFFDDFTACVRDACDKAVKENWKESYLAITRIFGEYFIRNRWEFAFSLIQVFSRKENDNILKEFRSRGVDFSKLIREKKDNAGFPSKFHLIMSTLIFWIAQYHYQNFQNLDPLNDGQVKQVLAGIESHILKGLSLNAEIAGALDFDKLERQLKDNSCRSEEKSLLKAVAGAVAEAGPWNVTMEMVACRSGLSKSGLYAHFENKQDMLHKLFISEFSGIISFAKAQLETSLIPEEQLYIGIISILHYLRASPEFLMSMEWLKTRKLGLEKMASEKLEDIIGSIKLEVIRQQDQQFLIMIAQWIFFMIVNILVFWPGIKSKTAAEIPNESFRTLFRFIALGLEGFNE